MSFAALRDLLDAAFDEAAGTLPAPQRHALAVALLRSSPQGTPPAQGAGGGGCRRSAPAPRSGRAAARGRRRRPVARRHVRGSARVCGATLGRVTDRALGRAPRERQGWCSTRPRPRLRRAADHGLDRPLSLGALHRLLRDRFGLSPPRPQLRRIHETSGGSPFFALQLARNLHERESRHVGARLPLPETLHELLGERLTALSEGTKDALLLAASSSDPTLDLLGRALEADAEILLEPAVDARIVEATEGTIRFAHPLFASAVYDAASTRARRHAHKRLAAASIDIEERARHLARSAPAHDPSVGRLSTPRQAPR